MSQPAWGTGAALGVFLLIAAYLIAGLPRLSAGMAGAVTAGLFVALMGTEFALLASASTWLQLVFPVSLLVIGHLAVTTKRFLVTEAGKLRSDDESAETNRMMGLALQGQGQLDASFDRFRRVPMSDEVMANLYNLALDFERKRQFNKAEAVLPAHGRLQQGLQGPGVQAQSRQEPVRDGDAGRRRRASGRNHAAGRRRGRKADARPLPG